MKIKKTVVFEIEYNDTHYRRTSFGKWEKFDGITFYRLDIQFEKHLENLFQKKSNSAYKRGMTRK